MIRTPSCGVLSTERILLSGVMSTNAQIHVGLCPYSTTVDLSTRSASISSRPDIAMIPEPMILSVRVSRHEY